MLAVETVCNFLYIEKPQVTLHFVTFYMFLTEIKTLSCFFYEVRLENVGDSAESVSIESLFKADTVAQIDEVSIGKRNKLKAHLLFTINIYNTELLISILMHSEYF